MHNPARIGYFPRTFTVSLLEYHELKEGGKVDDSNESSEQVGSGSLTILGAGWISGATEAIRLES